MVIRETEINENLRSFIDELIDGIQEDMPEKYHNCDIRVSEVMKNNYSYIGVTFETGTICPTINASMLYERFYDDVNEAVSIAVNMLRESEEQENTLKEIEKNMLSYEWVKEHLTIKLMNTQNNHELLEDAISFPVSTLSAVCCVTIPNGDGYYCVKLTRNLLEDTYYITEEQLIEDTMRSMRQTEPPIVTSMEMVAKYGICENSEITEEGFPYLLTNKDRRYGASYLADKEFMSSIAYEIGSDFIIIPSSIHEVIFIRFNDVDSDFVEGINFMVQNVNDTTMEDVTDVLSNEAYVYVVDEDKIVTLTEYLNAKEHTENEDVLPFEFNWEAMLEA